MPFQESAPMRKQRALRKAGRNSHKLILPERVHGIADTKGRIESLKPLMYLDHRLWL